MGGVGCVGWDVGEGSCPSGANCTTPGLKELDVVSQCSREDAARGD